LAPPSSIAVYGLWHLGSVTAACLAAHHRTVGLDLDGNVVRHLSEGRAPLHEPGLDDLIGEGLASGRLRFTSSAADALREAEVLWVTFDTPVDDRDEADVGFVRARLEMVAEHVRPGTLVLVSSQVPVGFTRALAGDWAARGVRVAYSPENLRLGKALEAFRRPDRVIVGLESADDRTRVTALFAPFCSRVEWMSIESAEMTKHAINAFLATSVTFINELARLCERVGADAREVERGLKSVARIGPRAYLGPGPAFAGGTLARDLRFLAGFGDRLGVETPLLDGVLASNDAHKGWLRETVARMLEGTDSPVAAVLGLTYKPGTSTLRRSASLELIDWLRGRGVAVRAHDPAIRERPVELAGGASLCGSAAEALAGADVAIVATEWPEYRALGADDFARGMRQPRVVDQGWFLAAALAADPRILYAAPGRPACPSTSPAARRS
jgi:UDPglucose 6-dehydrogenase